MCQTLGNKRSRTSSLTLLRPPPKPVHQPEGCTVSHPTTGRASNWHGRGAGRGQGRGARAALRYMGKRMKDGKGAASGRKRHLSYPALKERYVVFGFACCFVFKQKFLKRSRLHTNQFLIRKNLILSAPGTAERIITTPPTRARPSAGFAHRRGTPVSESHPFLSSAPGASRLSQETRGNCGKSAARWAGRARLRGLARSLRVRRLRLRTSLAPPQVPRSPWSGGRNICAGATAGRLQRLPVLKSSFPS